MSEVVVVIGAGSIGQAIARRVSAGKHVVLADLRLENADAAAEVMRDAGFDVSTATVDVSSRESVHALVETATALGDVTGVIHAAGVSPSQASPATILAVDLYGTALVLEEFGNVIASGGAGVVISSQSGHRLAALTADQNTALATTPTDELLELPMLQPDQVKSAPSARFSWAPRARSSPAATSSWTAESPPPTSTASSPPGNRSRPTGDSPADTTDGARGTRPRIQLVVSRALSKGGPSVRRRAGGWHVLRRRALRSVAP